MECGDLGHRVWLFVRQPHRGRRFFVLLFYYRTWVLRALLFDSKKILKSVYLRSPQKVVKMSITKNIFYFLFENKIYREKEQWSDIFITISFPKWLQWPEPGQESQETEIPSRFSIWVARAQIFGPSSAAFLGSLAGSRIQSGVAQALHQPIWNAGTADRGSAHHTRLPAP